MSDDGKTADIIGKLYNGFLLRDLLGYVVPGSFVLFCLAHLTATVTGVKLETLVKAATENVFMYVFVFGLCYASGHFLSGVFFHSPGIRRIFRYAPRNLAADYPSMSRDEAWLSHRSSYRKACEGVGVSIQGQIERHAALVHFTGHFSAGLLAALIYVAFLAAYRQSWIDLRYGVALVVAFPGIFVHYRRLVSERYLLERAAIRSSVTLGVISLPAATSQLPITPPLS